MAIFYCKNTLKKDESSLTNPSLSFNNCITLSSSDPLYSKISTLYIFPKISLFSSKTGTQRYPVLFKCSNASPIVIELEHSKTSLSARNSL